MNIFGTLGLIFITLKLLGFITWSWWLVLLPFYGGFVLIMLIGIIGGMLLTYTPRKNKNKGK